MAHTITRTAHESAAKCCRDLYLAITGNLIERARRECLCDCADSLANVRAQLIALDPASAEADAVLYAASRVIAVELDHITDVEGDE